MAQADVHSIGDGRAIVTVASTAERISTSTVLTRRVTVQAERNNTGVIAVGGSTVVAAIDTDRGSTLTAGDSQTLRARQLRDVWIDATVSGDGVTFNFEVA